ncbi:MAG: DUF294 nucleotidyltransferase-like domain-containing protein [Paracoccaceae bacterium]
MLSNPEIISRFLAAHHPFAGLSEETRKRLVGALRVLEYQPGETVYGIGDSLDGLYAIAGGTVGIVAPTGEAVSELHPGECFGERGLLLDGQAPFRAEARGEATLYLLPAHLFQALMRDEPGFALFFGRKPAAEAAPKPAAGDLATLKVADFMTPEPYRIAPDRPVREAAQMLRDKGVSCVLVAEADRLVGLLTASDLCGRVLAEGIDAETPVADVMTPEPISLPPDAIGLEAMTTMVERGIGHLPVVEGARLAGILTRTDMLLRSSLSSPILISEIGRRSSVPQLAAATAKLPALLAQLVGSGLAHQVVTRLMTDVTDALTRRLIGIAEERLGPPPVPYLWAVCGSQGRREQTGVSDQDNCLILSDAAEPGHDAYFAEFAKIVTDGLDTCGFYYCPGDMMATNPKWRQPVATWRSYFQGWIAKPDPMAQMLASVMFDLRPIAGDESLFAGLQVETLAAARRNSIFIAHMVANSLKHQPPLGLFRGFALIRSGEHKNALDLKMNGVVPVVDLGRLYALMGGLAPVNTHRRIRAAIEVGVVSVSGGRDLLDAYDLIAEMRLKHQAERVRAGARPDNFMMPAALSDLERNHLRDAFIVVKTMQSAAAQGRHAVA